MDRPKLLVSMIIVTSLFACEPPVTFTEPQPSGTKDLKHFPKKMRGHYVGGPDQCLLNITENYVIRGYDLDYKKSILDLDSTIVIVGDTAIDTETNEKTFVKIVGDSIAIHTHVDDTIFGISPLGKLKRYKGHYFMNRGYTTQDWEVKKLSLSKGILSLSSIRKETELTLLQELADKPSDTAAYTFEIAKKQFKRFVNAEGFSDTEFFFRLK